MKHLYTLFIVLALFSFNINSQTIQWDNTIGGSHLEWVFSTELASDGNYILGGYSFSNISGDKNENSRGLNDMWITKIHDNTGALLWQKTIGGNQRDLATSTKETSDGGYILGGYSNSNSSGEKTENSRGGDDYWVVKLDVNRNIVWDKTFGGTGVDRLWSIIETDDGGFLMGGESDSGISGDKNEVSRGFNDMWVIKIDSNGTIEWQKTYGGTGRDFVKSIVKSDDGGYVLAGTSTSDISGEKTENSRGFGGDYWVLKIDALGNIIWQRTLGGANGDNASFIQSTSDGDFIIGGDASSNISGEKTENSICNSVDVWLIKLDSNGQILWDKTIGGDSTEWIGNIRETNDRGFVFGAMSASGISAYKTEPSNGDRDYWIVKLDEFGNVEWDKTLGGSEMDHLTSVVQANDGSYIAGGWSTSDISGDKSEDSKGMSDHWMVKLTMNSSNYTPPLYSTISICEGENLQLNANSGTSYIWSGPNGFSSTEQNPIIANASSLNSGIYNVTITNNTSCIETQIINVTLTPSLAINSIDDLFVCDLDDDGFAFFDLEQLKSDITGTLTNLTISFYRENGQLIPDSELPAVQNIIVNEESITVRVENSDSSCSSESEFKLTTSTCEDSNVDFPHFFTPNNDGVNDVWPKTTNAKAITIYNRYGKVLKTLLQNEVGWDGTYNGKLLPPTDYWYEVITLDDKLIRGHFSLIREY